MQINRYRVEVTIPIKANAKRIQAIRLVHLGATVRCGDIALGSSFFIFCDIMLPQTNKLYIIIV